MEINCVPGKKIKVIILLLIYRMAYRIQAKILKLKTKMEKLQITQGELSRDLKEVSVIHQLS